MIGTVLRERYRLDGELGRGGMGVVYQAYDTVLDRAVAVKVLSASAVGTAGRARLLHEARAAAQLNHPNIIGVYDAGEDGGLSFIVMELLVGESLHSRPPADLSEIVDMARQVCAALEHAHAHGIIHRDLKPENILLTADGVAKLTDFGLARSAATRVTTEGALVGTVYYLSPEQALGQPVDDRTDLYALGVLLYELTAGRLPFVADEALTVITQHLYAPAVPPSTYNPAVAPALEALILQLLAKDPADRPPTAAVVGQALDRLAGLSPRDSPIPGVQLTVASSPLDRLGQGGLIGRERELAQARALWKQVAAGQGEHRVLLISGEAGVGKTPLVREITATAQVSGATVLAAECYAEGAALYEPLAQVIRAGLAAVDPDLPERALADLVALAPDLQPRYATVEPNPPLEPEAERQRLFESVAMLCTALAGRAPLLVVMEDVHWADGGTLHWLRHLARRSRTAALPLLILLTYEDSALAQACCSGQVLADLGRERLALQIELQPLDREQTGRTLARIFQEELPAALVDDLYSATEGNLFYLEEVARALVAEGKLLRREGRWHWAGGRAIDIPPSVRAAVQQRVARLPAEAQDVLRLAAVIGREFDFETLRRAGQWDEERLIEALEAAERAHLVTEVRGRQGETFAFSHTLTRGALQESLSGLRRRRLHRRVAAVLEALCPEDHTSLAYHHAQAGEAGRAAEYYTRAGQQAERAYGNEDAIQFYSAALALAEQSGAAAAVRFDLLAARGRVYDLVARRPEQRTDAEAMLALAVQLDDAARRCDALLALADFYIGTEFTQAVEPCQQAAALARSVGDAVREGQALRRLGWVAWQRQDAAESRRALGEAVALFRQTGRLAEAATCLHTLSLVLGIRGAGDLHAAQQAAEEALALSRQAGDRRQEAASLRRLAITCMDRFQFKEALVYFEQALDLHRALGDREGESHALNATAMALFYLRRPQEAERYFRDSLAVAEAIDSSMAVQIAVENLVQCHYLPQGQDEAGLAFLEPYVARVRALHNELTAASLQARRAEVLARLGQFEAARADMETVLPLIEQQAGPAFQARVLAFIGRMWAETGDQAQAGCYLDRAQERVAAQAGTFPIDLAQVLALRAYVAWLAGDRASLEQGLACGRQALDQLTGTGWHLFEAGALHAAAQVQLALGDVDAALANAARALELRADDPFPREQFQLVYAQALRAAGDEAQARAVLRPAYAWVTAVADSIQSPELHHGWLSRVRVNREIVQEWATLSSTDSRSAKDQR